MKPKVTFNLFYPKPFKYNHIILYIIVAIYTIRYFASLCTLQNDTYGFPDVASLILANIPTRIPPHIYIPVTWISFIVLIILVHKALIYKKTIEDLPALDYETVTIDDYSQIISFGNVSIPFSDIDFFKINIMPRDILWGYCDFGVVYHKLANAELEIHLKDKKIEVLPIQLRSSLEKICQVLKKYKQIEYNELNDKNNGEIPIWLWIENTILLWQLVFIINSN